MLRDSLDLRPMALLAALTRRVLGARTMHAPLTTDSLLSEMREIEAAETAHDRCLRCLNGAPCAVRDDIHTAGRGVAALLVRAREAGAVAR